MQPSSNSGGAGECSSQRDGEKAARGAPAARKTPSFPNGCTVTSTNFRYPQLAVTVADPRWYKGFLLTARTFQVRGSGKWTLDVTIGRRGSLRAFSSAETFPSERDATVACWRMACRIIDSNPPDTRVSDLSAD